MRKYKHNLVRRKQTLKLTFFSLLSSLIYIASCGSSGPRLSNFEFIGQAPDSSQVLIFSVEFIDQDGDLGRGTLDVFLNDQKQQSLSIMPMFQMKNVALDATSGQIRFFVELNTQSVTSNLPMKFSLEIKATDQAGNASNVEKINLQVTSR